MKKLAGMIILASSQLLSSGAGLNLIYPTGGEKLPGNGTHIFTWTNSDSMPVNLYVDWYDTNGNPIVTNTSLYATTLAAGTNTFTFYMPSNYPGADMYQYKVRLVGIDSGTNLESSSGYVTVTGPASFTGAIENTNQWLPGQSRNIDVSWSGFQAGDAYDVILEAPTLNKIGYGFLMTNMVMGGETGTQTVGIPYPSNSVAAYPPASYAPVNGPHSFTVMNRRCGIIQTFGNIDILTSGLRMYLVPLVITNVMRGDSVTAAKVVLDATLATNAVSVTMVKVVLTSYSSNRLAMICTLAGTNGMVGMQMLNFRPQEGSNYNTLVSFPANLTLAQGEVRELTLICNIIGPCELGSFIWDTENSDTNLLAGVTATYVGGATIPVSVIKSAGSYMSIEQLVNPKFLTGSGGGMPPPGGGSMTWSIICKPNTSYIVQNSTNFVNWVDMFTTNAVEGTLDLTLTNQNPWCFFRLKEN